MSQNYRTRVQQVEQTADGVRLVVYLRDAKAAPIDSTGPGIRPGDIVTVMITRDPK